MSSPSLAEGPSCSILLHRHHDFERVIALDINRRTHSLCYQDPSIRCARRSSLNSGRCVTSIPGYRTNKQKSARLSSTAVRSDWNASVGDVFLPQEKRAGQSERRQTIFPQPNLFQRPLSCEFKRSFQRPHRLLQESFNPGRGKSAQCFIEHSERPVSPCSVQPRPAFLGPEDLRLLRPTVSPAHHQFKLHGLL